MSLQGWIQSIQKLNSFVSFYRSIPYDHYLPFVFQGEEILQTIRGFTYGYDFYAPMRNVAFHMYAMNENKEARENIPKFTENEYFFGKEVKSHACKFNC